MQSDIHLLLHELRAAELTAAAPGRPARRRPLRAQLGWTLVALGLRLVAAPPPRTARLA
ncbi:hypothetical protein ACGF5F_12815 [Streptomyces sp. NPDC047821]|uniref:hypothetical protein n=1 Tax=unclassified Streptomyces TaxID=2593676 RepID=UPI0036332C29